MSLALIGSGIGWGSRHAASAAGPARLRRLGLAENLAASGVAAEWRAMIEAEPFRSGETPEKALSVVAAHGGRLKSQVEAALRAGEFPVTLGGDHSAAVGHYAGLAASLPEGARLGIVWIDAHGDLNTPETTPSGKLHGMPLAAILGHGLPELTGLMGGRFVSPGNLCMVALRDLDPGERDFIRRHGIRVMDMAEVGRRGLAACLAEARGIAARGAEAFGVSIDLDACDPDIISAVATPAPGGLDPEELLSALPALSGMAALEISEYAPTRPEGEEDAAARLVFALLRAANAARLAAAKGDTP
jgi:arginase